MSASEGPAVATAQRPLEGGCWCRRVRYRVSGPPVLSLLCFCRDCLATSGTDGYAGMMVREDDFEKLSGETATHTRTSASGRNVERHFCSACGSNLWGATQLGLVSVAAGSLDDPNAFEPTKAVFVSQAPAWARIPDGIEREE
jgi:hypothetical protein